MVVVLSLLNFANHLPYIRVQFFKFLGIDSQGLIKSFLNENKEIGNYFIGNETAVVLVNVNKAKSNYI
jgi:hypothetical protein